MNKTGLAIAAAVAASGVWALWPLRSAPLGPPVAPDASQRLPAVAVADLDVSAFRAPLWVVPTPPPAPAPPPAPPAPLKLQLLAVIHEDGLYKAVVYDPDADKILVAAAGERLGNRTVERVNPSGVELRDGAGLRTLVLRSDQGRVP